MTQPTQAPQSTSALDLEPLSIWTEDPPRSTGYCIRLTALHACQHRARAGIAILCLMSTVALLYWWYAALAHTRDLAKATVQREGTDGPTANMTISDHIQSTATTLPTAMPQQGVAPQRVLWPQTTGAQQSQCVDCALLSPSPTALSPTSSMPPLAETSLPPSYSLPPTRNAYGVCSAAALTAAAHRTHRIHFLQQQEAVRYFLQNTPSRLCPPNGTVDDLVFQETLHEMLVPLRRIIDQHVHSAFFVKSACAVTHEHFFGSTPSDFLCGSVILNHEPYNVSFFFSVLYIKR